MVTSETRKLWRTPKFLFSTTHIHSAPLRSPQHAPNRQPPRTHTDHLQKRKKKKQRERGERSEKTDETPAKRNPTKTNIESIVSDRGWISTIHTRPTPLKKKNLHSTFGYLFRSEDSDIYEPNQRHKGEEREEEIQNQKEKEGNGCQKWRYQRERETPVKNAGNRVGKTKPDPWPRSTTCNQNPCSPTIGSNPEPVIEPRPTWRPVPRPNFKLHTRFLLVAPRVNVWHKTSPAPMASQFRRWLFSLRTQFWLVQHRSDPPEPNFWGKLTYFKAVFHVSSWIMIIFVKY